MVLAIVIAAGFLIVVGLCVGWSMADMAYSQRSRRQAACQRRLNEEWQSLQALRQANLAGRPKGGDSRLTD